jgi:hypothetical protein
MNTWIAVAIIVFVLGIILGNILLLKDSAKSKFEKPPGSKDSANEADPKTQQKEQDDDWDDSW